MSGVNLQRVDAEMNTVIIVIAITLLSFWFLRRIVNWFCTKPGDSLLCRLGYHRWVDYESDSGMLYISPPGIRDMECVRCPARTVKRYGF